MQILYQNRRNTRPSERNWLNVLIIASESPSNNISHGGDITWVRRKFCLNSYFDWSLQPWALNPSSSNNESLWEAVDPLKRIVFLSAFYIHRKKVMSQSDEKLMTFVCMEPDHQNDGSRCHYKNVNIRCSREKESRFPFESGQKKNKNLNHFFDVHATAA